MMSMEKPWKVVLAFAGVFLAGAIFGGALAPRWLSHGRIERRGAFGGLHLMDRLSAELDLTAAQKEKIAPIVARAEAETRKLRRESVQSFRAVMERADVDIAAELTPEQRAKLEALRKRFRERMERFRSEGHGHEHNGPPPPPAAP